METKTTAEKFERLLRQYSDYDREGYNFIYEALDYTLKNLVKKRRSTQHVSGEELAKGLRLYAINQFGCLAQTILNELGIRTTEDIGNIVYNLIEFDLMGQQKSDKKEDFNNLYNFDKVFNLKPVFSYNSEKKEWKTEYLQN